MTEQAFAMKPVELALESLSPSLVVEVLPFGLTLNKILINGDGKTHDLLIGPEDKEDHRRKRGFLHTIVGRYANRIPAGEFTLERDGIQSHLSVAATESPEVSLHGGAEGFDRLFWQVIQPTETGRFELFSEAEKRIIRDDLASSAIFKLASPNGDQGYPGTVEVEVLVGLQEPLAEPLSPGSDVERELGSIIIVYRARLAEGQDQTITPVNLTQHWGFNLDASLAGASQPTPDVKKHNLTIKSDNRIALKANGLATGELIPTLNTAYDHNGKLIGGDFPDGGYDEYYLFDKPADTTPSRMPLSQLANLDVLTPLIQASGGGAKGVKSPVELASKQSGIRLSFLSNQPGVQLYTGNLFTGGGSRKRIHGGTTVVDDGYKPGAGTFLEFHEPLAAWMHPWGQEPGKDTLLANGELYNNYTKLTIHFKPVPSAE